MAESLIRLPSVLSPATPLPSRSARRPMLKAAQVLRPGFSVQDEHRKRAAALAGDPERYLFEIFGWSLARDQKRAVEAWRTESKLLLIGANGTGKSALLHALALGPFWDATGSQPGEDGGCQGAVILLIAPHDRAIKKAYQKHFLELGRKAKGRGHLLPGWGKHSERSADWQAIEGRWYIEGITVAKGGASTDEVAHSALGTHFDNLGIILDEVKAIEPAVVEACKGRLRGAKNWIAGSSNPTSATGLGYKLSQVDRWRTIYSSAVGRLGYDTGKGEGFEVQQLEAHENVQQRRVVFPGCVSHKAVEEDLRDRSMFEIRGELWTSEGDPDEGYARPNATAGDFPYALPEPRVKDKLGPREDGYPGHVDVPVLVIRPLTGTAYGRIVGGWPPMDPHSLFTEYGLLKAVQLRATLPAPDGPPRVVGVDASTSERGDEMVAVPWWGPPARELIEMAWSSRSDEGSSIQAGAEALVNMARGQDGNRKKLGQLSPGNVANSGAGQAVRVPGRENQGDGKPFPGVPAYVGEPLPLPVSNQGADAAGILIEKWGTDPLYQIDPAHGAGLGASLMAQGCTVLFMQFGGQALPPLPGQTRAALNARALWAFDLADAVSWGLVGFCRDEQTRSDLTALGAPEEKSMAAVRIVGTGGKVQVFKVREKAEIKKYLGRSPDRGDATLAASAKPPLATWE